MRTSGPWLTIAQFNEMLDHAFITAGPGRAFATVGGAPMNQTRRPCQRPAENEVESCATCVRALSLLNCMW